VLLFLLLRREAEQLTVRRGLSFHLIDNGLRSDGALAVARALRLGGPATRRIQSLSFYANDIGDAGLGALPSLTHGELPPMAFSARCL
jgi:hypothetical protein